jgi:sarcosine oxidase
MTYDVIVLGLGAMGSATASVLARRGLRVLGLDRHDRGHTLGSSHGHTRIIRTAYYEHPDYVPLCRSAFGLWHDLEQRRGQHLLTSCPCLSIGTPDSELIRGVRSAAESHGLSLELLDAGQLRARYPQFQLGDSLVGALEQASGILYVDDCVRALQDDAARSGAELRFHEPVQKWKSQPGGVAVKTAWENLSAGALVVTAGPWARPILADLNLPLTVMRQTPLWFRPHRAADFRRDRFPIFLVDLPGGAFYGIPMLDSRGIKAALHYAAPEVENADEVSREVTLDDEQPVRAFLREYLPDAAGPCTDGSTCLYTLTPDRHFVVDRHPSHERVAIAAGFSGHGFKFAPAIGEALADLVTTGRTEWPIGLFSARRFQTT